MVITCDRAAGGKNAPVANDNNGNDDSGGFAATPAVGGTVEEVLFW